MQLHEEERRHTSAIPTASGTMTSSPSAPFSAASAAPALPPFTGDFFFLPNPKKLPFFFGLLSAMAEGSTKGLLVFVICFVYSANRNSSSGQQGERGVLWQASGVRGRAR